MITVSKKDFWAKIMSLKTNVHPYPVSKERTEWKNVSTGEVVAVSTPGYDPSAAEESYKIKENLK